MCVYRPVRIYVYARERESALSSARPRRTRQQPELPRRQRRRRPGLLPRHRHRVLPTLLRTSPRTILLIYICIYMLYIYIDVNIYIYWLVVVVVIFEIARDLHERVMDEQGVELALRQHIFRRAHAYRIGIL